MKREEREFTLRLNEFEVREKSPGSEASFTAMKVTGFGKVPLPAWEEKTRIDTYLNTCERLLEGAEIKRRHMYCSMFPLRA